MSPRFFDVFPAFYDTSSTGAGPNRLNSRYRVLIEQNARLIRDKAVLDVASHDGRWSFAAHRTGARHVCGIEVRDHLIKIASETLHRYGVTHDEVNFINADVHQALPHFKPGEFDTSFCFGFLYHTAHHLQLITQLSRLKVSSIIIDTRITNSTESVIHLKFERTVTEANGFYADQGQDRTLIGIPSKLALQQMLAYCGFRIRYLDWHDGKQSSWADLEDYRRGLRVSLIATRVTQS